MNNFEKSLLMQRSNVCHFKLIRLPWVKVYNVGIFLYCLIPFGTKLRCSDWGIILLLANKQNMDEQLALTFSFILHMQIDIKNCFFISGTSEKLPPGITLCQPFENTCDSGLLLLFVFKFARLFILLKKIYINA